MAHLSKTLYLRYSAHGFDAISDMVSRADSPRRLGFLSLLSLLQDARSVSHALTHPHRRTNSPAHPNPDPDLDPKPDPDPNPNPERTLTLTLNLEP